MSRYYARVDTLGRVVGFYSDDVHGPRRIKIVDPSFNKATTPEGDWPVVAVVDRKVIGQRFKHLIPDMNPTSQLVQRIRKQSS